jgi:hypothetical protein
MSISAYSIAKSPKNANIIIMAGIERTIENNILKKYVVPFIVPENLKNFFILYKNLNN